MSALLAMNLPFVIFIFAPFGIWILIPPFGPWKILTLISPSPSKLPFGAFFTSGLSPSSNDFRPATLPYL